jgi:hypothetical protein
LSEKKCVDELSVLEDVEKMRRGGLEMKIIAKEFDKRFDNGEDIFDLMENPKVLTLNEFEKVGELHCFTLTPNEHFIML